MRKRQTFKIACFVLLVFAVTNCLISGFAASHQVAKATRAFETKFVCQQTDNSFEGLLAEANQNKYVVRRVEFAGNEFTRDYKLRRRVIKEEAIFSQAALAKSLKNLRRLNLLKSARLGNVAIDSENKFIDIVFEVEESEKAKKR